MDRQTNLSERHHQAKDSAPQESGDRRCLPIGAEVLPSGAASFRVWAPKRKRAELVANIEKNAAPVLPTSFAMRTEANGYFSLTTTQLKAGTCYGFRFEDDPRVWGDPGSRFQPDGPAGLSELIDPRAFAWSDQNWRGVQRTGQVVYELHIGTFTPAGTWASAAAELPELAEAGMTLLQVMPVADFPGQFGWGYDGVCLYAPTRLYGRPDDFRAFVDTAHRLGLGVILDVVYNHWGAVENHLSQYSDDYASACHECEWGCTPNFDGPSSAAVREYFTSNARYWIEEFHLDGFRFDATQAIHDHSSRHVFTDIVLAARDAAHGRNIVLSAENEPQHARIVRPIEAGGHGCDWICNDDFHHSARVRLTDSNPAYYSDFLGSTAELVASVRHGFIYQGQWSRWQQKPRGTPARDLKADAFVHYLQNHDQVANSLTGERLDRLTSPGRLRAMTALWLLSPQTPLFFQGQEFAASSPFLFFADHPEDQRQLVADGRAAFLSQFPAVATPEGRAALSPPCDRSVFERCRLNLKERQTNHAIYDLHKDLLKLRRDDAVFRRHHACQLDAAVLTPDVLAVRYYGETAGDRLVVVNFGRDWRLCPLGDPVCAPPAETGWQLLWSSSHPKYGGSGTAEVQLADGWRLPGQTTFVLQSAPLAPESDAGRPEEAAP
ncbi:MAG TPA: malto-oligosyltrehalose trehalohydrolase [Pirellulales bacterium]|jgi:maltooligosyltrehalose trehalohydrolase